MLEGGLQAVEADEDVVGTSRVRELERRVASDHQVAHHLAG
jgi:transposase